jgi:hypothetical protein
MKQVVVGWGPDPAAQPQGPAVVCPGSTGTTYTTVGAGYATSYAWEITPANAGTIDGTTTSAVFNASSTYSGTVNIIVKGVNECGEGTASPSFDVTVSDPVAAPAKPEGVDSVNIADVPSSEFTTTGVPSVSTYEWAIAPAAAGTITGTGLTGAVTWDLSFRGPSATIVVKGTDDCGPGLPSPDKTVAVKNTLGIPNVNELGAEIYPNPNSGKFVIVLQGNEKNINIRILNTLGSLVYTENIVKVTGKITKNIDLSMLSEGVYYLKAETETGTLIRKLVIRK